MVTIQLPSSYGGGDDGRYFSNKSIMKIAYITMFFLVSIILLSPSLREESSARSVSKLSTQLKKMSTIFDQINANKTTNGTILFMHLAKSGGSSVCQQIGNKEIRMTDQMGNQDKHRANCNVMFKQTNPPYKYAWHEPHHCVDLNNFTTNKEGQLYRRHNFIAIERPWYDEMPCPGLRSFAVMRNPVARFVSLLDYFKTDKQLMIKYMKNQTFPKYNEFAMRFQIHPTNSWTIRQLLGYNRAMDPRLVDNDDFLRAKVLVDRFDAFIPLEYLHNNKVHSLLNATIPEYLKTLQTNKIHMNKSEKRETSHNLTDLLTESNKFDIMLYNYVLEKHGLSVLPTI